jgi:DNA-binding transcriptional LysR family regulator
MYDSFTLDQLRALLTVVEEGSFSAAARKLGRVQSAISTAMANLETQLGMTLLQRGKSGARLTSEGQAVAAAARRILTEVDGFRRLTAGLAEGQEPVVSLCVDVLFPLPALIDLATGFARAFPLVDLRIDTQLMSVVAARVLAGAATLGVATPLGILPGLERRALAPILMIPVVAPNHPLAKMRAPLPAGALANAIQIVLSERNEGRQGAPDQAVLSTRTWRVADLHAKHALLMAGLGWGNLPEHLVRADLAARRLIAIRPEAWSAEEHTLSLSAVWRPDTTLGPAHRWVLSQMETLCVQVLAPPGKPAAASARKARKAASGRKR